MSTRRLTVTARDLDEGGAGVAEAGGVEVHVADLLPGESAEVEVVHRSRHRAASWARLVERTGPLSGHRTEPACPAAGRCGGCAWQHLAYPAQLDHKRARVAAALAAAGVAAEVEPVVASPAELGYRHKGKYVVATRRGRVVLGAWAPRSHDLVDTAGCRVVAPIVDELRERVRAAVERAGLAPYHEPTGAGALRYVVIRAAPNDPSDPRAARALVALVVRSTAPAPAVAAVAADVAEDPRVAGVVRVDNDRRDGAILSGPITVITGGDHLDATVAGVPVALGTSEFAQVNPAQADRLYARVAELAGLRPGDRAADVYAGLGGISFALAATGAEVVAIEHEPAAVAALAAAARAAGLPVEVRAGDAAGLADVAGPLAVVVVNPPRKGLSVAARAAVAAAPVTRLIYVSCGPASLARDLAALAAAGWHPTRVEPFDLMPGTAQVETVVVAERRAAAAAGTG